MNNPQLLSNVHLALSDTLQSSKEIYTTRGKYDFFHYACDGFQDEGWGCGYRTLQSMCSWIINSKQSSVNVPNIPEIQQILVNIRDKPTRFFGSRDFIGTLEATYVIDTLFGVSCKLIHVRKGEDFKNYKDPLLSYFKDIGGFGMMGGDLDTASKGVAGIKLENDEILLLVVDPHYRGKTFDIKQLSKEGFVYWQNVKDFVNCSFYNLCLPQLSYTP